MKSRKKETGLLSFSYLDLIFLLLAGLIFSLGIHVATQEKRKEEAVPVYRIEATLFYKEAVAHALPKAGETLFDEKGEGIGLIEEANLYETEGKKALLITCFLRGETYGVGDDFAVDTSSFHGEATVLSVTEEKAGEVF